jgi:hypothetical protein
MPSNAGEIGFFRRSIRSARLPVCWFFFMSKKEEGIESQQSRFQQE